MLQVFDHVTAGTLPLAGSLFPVALQTLDVAPSTSRPAVYLPAPPPRHSRVRWQPAADISGGAPTGLGSKPSITLGFRQSAGPRPGMAVHRSPLPSPSVSPIKAPRPAHVRNQASSSAVDSLRQPPMNGDTNELAARTGGRMLSGCRTLHFGPAESRSEKAIVGPSSPANLDPGHRANVQSGLVDTAPRIPVEGLGKEGGGEPWAAWAGADVDLGFSDTVVMDSVPLETDPGGWNDTDGQTATDSAAESSTLAEDGIGATQRLNPRLESIAEDTKLNSDEACGFNHPLQQDAAVSSMAQPDRADAVQVLGHEPSPFVDLDAELLELIREHARVLQGLNSGDALGCSIM